MGCTTARSFRVRVGISPPIPVFVRVQQTLSASTGKAYQWFKDEIAIAGATNKTLQLQGNYNGNYKVGVMNGDSCWNYSFPLSISDIVSVQEETQGWLLYPNPVSSVVNIQRLGADLEAHIEIQSIIGTKMIDVNMAATDTHISIDLGAVEQGIYILVLGEKGMRQKVYKVIKE